IPRNFMQKNPKKHKKRLVIWENIWYAKSCDSTHPGILRPRVRRSAAWVQPKPGGGKNERMI
ncbi:MAG: hypothetical protein LIO70_05695, partial [Clostridiales bacterium]|nr:hypothetical protein [Clostridiales bacterium]